MTMPLFAVVTFVTTSADGNTNANASLGTFRVPITVETSVRELAKDAMKRLLHSRRAGNDNTLAAYQPLKISEVYVLCNILDHPGQKAEILATDLVVNVVAVRDEVIYMSLLKNTQATLSCEVTKLSSLQSTSSSATSTQDSYEPHAEENMKTLMSTHPCQEKQQRQQQTCNTVTLCTNMPSRTLSEISVNTCRNITSSVNINEVLAKGNKASILEKEVATTSLAALEKAAKLCLSHDMETGKKFDQYSDITDNKEKQTEKCTISSLQQHHHQCQQEKQEEKEEEEEEEIQTRKRRRENVCDSNKEIRNDNKTNKSSSHCNESIENASTIYNSAKRSSRLDLDAGSGERIRRLREREMARLGWGPEAHKHFADNYVSSPDKLMRRRRRGRRESKSHKLNNTCEAREGENSGKVVDNTYRGQNSNTNTRGGASSSNSDEKVTRHVSFSTEHIPSVSINNVKHNFNAENARLSLSKSKTCEKCEKNCDEVESGEHHHYHHHHLHESQTVDVDVEEDDNNDDDDNNDCKPDSNICLYEESRPVASYFVNSPQLLPPPPPPPKTTTTTTIATAASSFVKNVVEEAKERLEANEQRTTLTKEYEEVVDQYTHHKNCEASCKCMNEVCEAGKAISRKIAVARQLLFSQVDNANEHTPDGRSTTAHIVHSFEPYEAHNNNNKNSDNGVIVSTCDNLIKNSDECKKDECKGKKLSKEEIKVLKTSKRFARQVSPEKPPEELPKGWGTEAWKYFDPETYCDDPNKAHLILKKRKKLNEANNIVV